MRKNCTEITKKSGCLYYLVKNTANQFWKVSLLANILLLGDFNIDLLKDDSHMSTSFKDYKNIDTEKINFELESTP